MKDISCTMSLYSKRVAVYVDGEAADGGYSRMIKYVCDMCGMELADDDLVYDVKIEVKAIYKELEINLSDLLKDHMDEIRELVEKTKDLPPGKLQDDVYREMTFHLCYQCQQRYLKDPLGKRGPDARTDRGSLWEN